MRPLIAITQVSVDGVMQSPGGQDEDPSNGFTHGGWAMAQPDPMVREELGRLMASDFSLLLGRRTYEIWADYWPHHGDNAIGKAFNQATKHVATRTLTRLDWAASQGIGAMDVVADVRRLKAEDGPALHLWGSSHLLQTLIAAGLVDEHRLWVIPVVLGQGKRLFEAGVPARRMVLVDSRATPTGVLLITYRVAKC